MHAGSGARVRRRWAGVGVDGGGGCGRGRWGGASCTSERARWGDSSLLLGLTERLQATVHRHVGCSAALVFTPQMVRARRVRGVHSGRVAHSSSYRARRSHSGTTPPGDSARSLRDDPSRGGRGGRGGAFRCRTAHWRPGRGLRPDCGWHWRGAGRRLDCG